MNVTLLEYGVQSRQDANHIWILEPEYTTRDLAQHKVNLACAERKYGKDNVRPVVREYVPWCEMKVTNS